MMQFTDQIGEWCAVLETLAQKEPTQEWRKRKILEVIARLKRQRDCREVLAQAVENVGNNTLFPRDRHTAAAVLREYDVLMSEAGGEE